MNRINPRISIRTRNLLLLGIGTLLLAGLWWKVQEASSRQAILDLLAWVENLGWVGCAIFSLALIAVCMSGILPASMLAVAAGSIYGLGFGFLLCAVSILAAACLAFLLSRYILRGQFQALESRFSVLERLDGEIADSGWRLVFLLRMSPLAPFGLVSYVFGLSRVSLGDYILGTLASLPALLALVYTGAIAGETVLTLGGVRPARNWAEWAILGGGFIATLASVSYLSLLARRALDKAIKLRDEQ